jgi:adenylate cyclase
MWWLWPHLKRIWAVTGAVAVSLAANYLFAVWGRQSVPRLADLSGFLYIDWYWAGAALITLGIFSGLAARAHRTHLARQLMSAGSERRATVPPFWATKNRYWLGTALSLAALTIVAIILVRQHILGKTRSAYTILASLDQPPALPSIPSIAVLPFENLSGDPTKEYFSDGITDELITKLSRLGNVLVIARTSTFSYKGKQIKTQEIGRDLGVKYLLEGSVYPSGDQVRIEARLVEADTGGQMWADHFDRSLNQIFAVQDQIVQTIVSTLDLQMSLIDRGVWARARQNTDNPISYEDVLRGLVYRWRETKEDDAEALNYFEKAIQLDPNYIDAYVLASATIFNDWDWQWTQDPHALDRALAYLQTALKLDDSHAAAHVLRGRILLERGQFDLAAAETDRGIKLAPKDVGAFYCSAGGTRDWAADTLNWSGKPAEALEIAENALRHDPGNRDFHLAEIGFAYYKLGHPAEAIPVLKRFTEAYPGFVDARCVLTASYIETGMVKQAHAEAAQIMTFSPHFSLEAGLFKDVGPQDRLVSDLRAAGLK